MPTSELQPYSGTISAADQRLNALIEQWAMENRITAEQAETIRQRILSSSVTLRFDWWWNLFRNIGLVEKKDWDDSMRVTFANGSLAQMLSEVVPAWTCDFGRSTTFLPYLRLVSC